MKNHNDEALQNYFSSMLNEKESPQVIVDTAPVKLNIPTLPENLVFSEVEVLSEDDNAQKKDESTWKNIEVEDNFQVLFFELSDLMFAVPLADLGGIYQLDDSINSLIGKPEWFSGVMTHNESLFNIVDTAKWINTGQSAQTLNYSHCVLLGSTKWGLSCEKLLGTEMLSRSQIKWRTASGKRPWLAGMVKKKMCALIHAEELVKLLNSGINIHGH
ncbi:MAG: chemotaxis protein CheW [Psychromonas sp.]